MAATIIDGKSLAAAVRAGLAVGGVDDAAGEDPRPAVVIAALGAPQQQDLDPDRGVADDDQRRRRPRRALGNGSIRDRGWRHRLASGGSADGNHA